MIICRYGFAARPLPVASLHQAVLGDHEAVVRVLVSRGARLDIRDTIWHGTPLGWAVHGGKARTEMAECLRSLGAVE